MSLKSSTNTFLKRKHRQFILPTRYCYWLASLPWGQTAISSPSTEFRCNIPSHRNSRWDCV